MSFRNTTITRREEKKLEVEDLFRILGQKY